MADKPLLLLLGDSLVDYGDWPRLLPRYRVISSGVPGERAGELLHRLPVRPPGLDPDAVVVMSGTNDLFFGAVGFTAALDRVVMQLMTSHPGAEVVLCSLLPYEIAGLQERVETVNEELRVIAARNGCHYFDLWSVFQAGFAPLFDIDGVHLSDAGYRLWAESLAAWLPGRLAKRRD